MHAHQTRRIDVQIAGTCDETIQQSMCGMHAHQTRRIDVQIAGTCDETIHKDPNLSTTSSEIGTRKRR
jgi:hypothetical protein